MTFKLVGLMVLNVCVHRRHASPTCTARALSRMRICRIRRDTPEQSHGRKEVLEASHAVLCRIPGRSIARPPNAESAYISDELTVPLRSGPSNAHRILHRGLPSGTQLEIIGRDDDAGFTQVRTSRGTEGWIRSQYLVSQPIAKMRLAAAQRELSNAKRELAAQARASTNCRPQPQPGNQLTQAPRRASSELEARARRDQARFRQRRRSARAKPASLEETNARLRDEMDDLAEERNRLQTTARTKPS